MTQAELAAHFSHLAGRPRRPRARIWHRSKTLAEITDGARLDAPWPPRVCDRPHGPRERALALLPRRETPRQRRQRREAIARVVREFDGRKTGTAPFGKWRHPEPEKIALDISQNSVIIIG